MIDYISDEEDVKDILRAPFSGVISDATYPSGGRVHPRVYGTFARLIENTSCRSVYSRLSRPCTR